jgi:hypothetical protein
MLGIGQLPFISLILLAAHGRIPVGGALGSQRAPLRLALDLSVVSAGHACVAPR